MKLIIVTYLTALVLTSLSIQAVAAPSAPTLTHSINGLTVTTSWSSVPGAIEYTLSYAPIPYTGPESIASLSVGGQTSFSATLWEGAAFFIAVQAGDGLGFSEYSNIDSFTITTSSVNLTGNWAISETQGPNNCGENPNFKWDYTITINQIGLSITASSNSCTSCGSGGLDITAGNIVGNTVTLSTLDDDKHNNAGFDMYVSTLSVLSEDEISGSTSYTSINSDDGESPCSGAGSITGHRIK